MDFFNTLNIEGQLKQPHNYKNFSEIPWTPHQTFQGVFLKHLITGEDTQGKFSYHLVRIEPHKIIGTHIHETQWETHEVVSGKGTCQYKDTILNYQPGTITIFPEKEPHEIRAGKKELLLLAKFIPALL